MLCLKKVILVICYTIVKARGGGGGGKRHFFSFPICDRAAEDEQVEKPGSNSDHAFLRYCAPKSEVYL